MAISPRRSSRSARTSQPGSVTQQHTQSSASSVSSGRADRNARSNYKIASPRPSVPARSESADDFEDLERPQTRRTRSTQEDQKDDPSNAIEDEIDDEAGEDVTRCICGNQEYPGLPTANPDSAKKSDPSSTASEDSTGWFIQCDNCKVWQHGGCVGMMDESTSPDEYFCEQCRKDLHKIMTTPTGRKYSLFLPAQDRKSEQASPEPLSQKAKETSRKARDSRSTRTNPELTKGRRPTMNSRDSKYDEDAEFLRALEESKKEALASNGTGQRKGKRSRSESEEIVTNNKRQRTASGSSLKNKDPPRDVETEEEEEAEKEEKHKNIRGAAARNQKAKQEREREVAEHTEVSSKRKARIDKRKEDDSDPSPEPLIQTNSAKSKVANENSLAPPPVPEPAPQKASHHKKTGRPPAKRGRVGRNQYTRDRDPPSTDNLNGISPARSHNSQEHAEPHMNGNGPQYESNGAGKPSRPRHMHPVRTTMNDMKKRVAGILEFISHQQVEAAGLDPNSSTKTSTSANSPPDTNANSSSVDLVKVSSNAIRDLDELDQEVFGSLNSKEMMAVLERRLMKWQQEYGKYGEKG